MSLCFLVLQSMRYDRVLFRGMFGPLLALAISRASLNSGLLREHMCCHLFPPAHVFPSGLGNTPVTEIGGSPCYKFILIFNSGDCQNMFIPSRCLYAAPDYVINVRECGHLDSCRVASCLCNNVHVDVRAYVIMST